MSRNMLLDSGSIVYRYPLSSFVAVIMLQFYEFKFESVELHGVITLCLCSTYRADSSSHSG